MFAPEVVHLVQHTVMTHRHAEGRVYICAVLQLQKQSCMVKYLTSCFAIASAAYINEQVLHLLFCV